MAQELGGVEGNLLSVVRKHSKVITTLVNTCPIFEALFPKIYEVLKPELSFDKGVIEQALDVVVDIANSDVFAADIVEIYKSVSKRGGAGNGKEKERAGKDKFEQFIDLASRILKGEDVQKLLNLTVRGFKSKDENISASLDLAKEFLESDDFYTGLQSLGSALLLFKALPEIRPELKNLRLPKDPKDITEDMKVKVQERDELQKRRYNLLKRCEAYVHKAGTTYIDFIKELKAQGKLIKYIKALEWLINDILFGKLLLKQGGIEKVREKFGYDIQDLVHQVIESPDSLRVIQDIVFSMVLIKDAPRMNKVVEIGKKSASSIYNVSPVLIRAAGDIISQHDPYRQSLAKVLKDAARKYKYPKRFAIKDEIIVGHLDPDFSKQKYSKLNFVNCEVDVLKNGKNLSISESVITTLSFVNSEVNKLDANYCEVNTLIIKDSKFVECNFDNIEASHIEIDNVELDAKTFISLISSLHRKVTQTISIKRLTIDKSFVEAMEGNEEMQRYVRYVLSAVPSITQFIQDNPSLSQGLEGLYTHESVRNDLVKYIEEAFPNCPNHKITKLSDCIKEAIKELSVEELKKVIYLREEVVGIKGKSGLLKYLTAEWINRTSLQSDINLFISEKLAVREVPRDLTKAWLPSPASLATSLNPKRWFRPTKQNLGRILDDASSNYVRLQKEYLENEGKEIPERVDIKDEIIVDDNKMYFSRQSYLKLNFANCEVTALDDGTDLNISWSTIAILNFTNSGVNGFDASGCAVNHLTVKDSELLNCNLKHMKVQNVGIDNVCFDGESFIDLISSLRNSAPQSISIKNITIITPEFFAAMEKSEGKKYLRDVMSVVPSITKFAADNPQLADSVQNLYTHKDVLDDLLDDIKAKFPSCPECNIVKLKSCLEKAIEGLNAEELKKLIYLRDEVTGARGWEYWGNSSGLIKYLSVPYIASLNLQEHIDCFIAEKVGISDVDRDLVKSQILSLLDDKVQAFKGDANLQELHNLVSRVIDSIDDRCISLLNKKSKALVGDQQYSFFSSYYYTGLLSIVDEISFTKTSVLERDIRRIFMTQLGATADIFSPMV